MDNHTIIKISTPRFGINEIVYLRESALLGYLEALKVYNIYYSRAINRNMYVFRFYKSKPSTQIAGDAIDLKSDKNITIVEEELLNYTEALGIVSRSLKKELNKINNKLYLDIGYPLIEVTEQKDTTDTTSQELDYGDVSTGSHLDKKFIITNTGKSDLIINEILIVGDSDFIIQSSADLTINPAQSTNFIVRFSPSTSGRRVGSIIIDSNSKDGKYYFSFTGNGV